jgi:SAM-dependent methyltransferase
LNFALSSPQRTAPIALPSRFFDYGCGAGEIVGLMRNADLEAVGCEAFYEGGDYSPMIPQDLRPFIFRMDGDRTPFVTGSFDLVINNQVLEHVTDLDVVVHEIARVLKPGGSCLSLFPDKGVWREGHCGIPFLHWFPKKTTPRIYYALALRSLGLGYNKGSKTPIQWSRDFCQWLDDWCYYRSYDEIAKTFARHLSAPSHIEPEWIEARSSKARFAPPWVRKLVANKMAGMVFVARKQGGR